MGHSFSREVVPETVTTNYYQEEEKHEVFAFRFVALYLSLLPEQVYFIVYMLKKILDRLGRLTVRTTPRLDTYSRQHYVVSRINDNWN